MVAIGEMLDVYNTNKDVHSTLLWCGIQLLDDPIPVPITDLEKNENFLNHILPAMRRGQSGQYNVPNGRENPYTVSYRRNLMLCSFI